MSQLPEPPDLRVTRRQVISGAFSIAVLCVLDCEPALAQSADHEIKQALDDPTVDHGLIEFDGGHERIGGYLARPRAKGRFPVVLVVTGSSIEDEYIRNLTAMLAQAGFVGFAPDIFALQRNGKTPGEKRRIFADQITDDYLFADLDASIAYLNRQGFVSPGRFGVVGFCFGGRCALLYAARNRNVGAVVPFYGNLKTPDFAQRKIDPLDVPEKIHAPVQGHYSKSDDEIPPTQLADFEAALRRGHTPVDVYMYDAPHGFFAYNRRTYDENAAREAWARASQFLKERLGG